MAYSVVSRKNTYEIKQQENLKKYNCDIGHFKICVSTIS